MDKKNVFVCVLMAIFFIALIWGMSQIFGNHESYERESHKSSKKKLQRNNQHNIQESKPSKTFKEGFELGKDFYIYNYLKKPVRIYSESILKQSNPPKPSLIATINPHSKRGFSMKDIKRYITYGSEFSVYILNDNNCEALFSRYKLDVPEGTTIRMLHVGMITSRWVGADGESSISPGLNAVQGLPWIKIHNMTEYPISLNNNINISGGGVLRYSGRDAFGVRLGTIFEDQDGVFEDFIFTTPATDVYYGVVSDIQQSLFGGFQLFSELDDSAYEPQFLLENWMGGPAYPKIPYGFLPTLGKDVPPQNRWGQPATEFNIDHPVGSPPKFQNQQ